MLNNVSSIGIRLQILQVKMRPNVRFWLRQNVAKSDHVWVLNFKNFCLGSKICLLWQRNGCLVCLVSVRWVSCAHPQKWKLLAAKCNSHLSGGCSVRDINGWISGRPYLLGHDTNCRTVHTSRKTKVNVGQHLWISSIFVCIYWISPHNAPQSVSNSSHVRFSIS